MIIRLQPNRLAAPLATALALAACHPSAQEVASGNDQTQALPPLAGGAASEGVAASSARAPAAQALPAARPLAYSYAEAPGPDGYGWIDQADLLLDTIGDAPPDYAFDYYGVEPWAWETADQYEIFVEPIDGGWRYYYYAPDAFEPFLVRDPYYSYGYRDGRVVAVYGADGRYLARAAALRQADAASRYYVRARALRAAARDRSRLAIASARWADQRRAVTAARRQWDQARVHEDGWQRLRAERQATVDRHAGERAARAGAAQRFAAWQQAHFRGPPPRLYEGQPNQPAARLLARRETAARQADLRRQARAEAGRRAAAIAGAQAPSGEAGARRAALIHQREAQARPGAAAAGIGRAPAPEAAAQHARAGAIVRQHQQAQAQAQAQRRAALVQQRAVQAQQHVMRAQAQAQRQMAHAQQRAAQAQRRAAPAIQPLHAVQAIHHGAQAPRAAPAPAMIRAPHGPRAQAGAQPGAAPAARHPDGEGHGRGH